MRSPNTKRFEHTLVAHYRFDEAGGNLLFNTSPLNQRIDSKIFEDTIRTDIDWLHYVYLNANETFDPESKRSFLFCLEPNSRRVDKHCECKFDFLYENVKIINAIHSALYKIVSGLQ